MDCMKCRYSMIASDDAYGATIRWVEGCKLTESGKPCPYKEEDEDANQSEHKDG